MESLKDFSPKWKMENLEAFSPKVEALSLEFFNEGGRGFTIQTTRGEGYTTFIVAQCLMQLLYSDRSVIFVSDLPYPTTSTAFLDIAWDYFAVRGRINRISRTFEANNKTLKIIKPSGDFSSIRGQRFHDLFGEVSTETMFKKQSFFEYLSTAQIPDPDIPGYSYFVYRRFG
jgi:hypothetical protein